LQKARDKQINERGCLNHKLTGKALVQCCKLSTHDEKLLQNAVEKFKFSMRAHHRILRIARTIADLADCKNITTPHLMEALSYRATASFAYEV
jgi:magnesium chelatase family protein